QPGPGVGTGQQVDGDPVAGLPVAGDLQDRRAAYAPVGEQHVLREALAVAAHRALQSQARQPLAQPLELVGAPEGHQTRAPCYQGKPELFGYLVTDATAAQSRDRQRTAGNYQ